MAILSPYVGPSFLGSGTFAQMKAVTGMADAASYLVTNYGRGGSIWRYSASLTDWFPTSPVLAYENTTLISGLVQLAAQVLVAAPMEANLLKNKRFRILVTTAKNGTTDTPTTTLRLGSTGTTADASFGTLAALTTTQRAIGTETWLRMASTTSAELLGGSRLTAFGNVVQTTATFAATTIGDVTALNYVTVTCTMSGTTDTPQLGYVAVEIMP